MLAQPWLVLIYRLPFQSHSVCPFHIILNLIEIFGPDTRSSGAVDVSSGVMSPLAA